VTHLPTDFTGLRVGVIGLAREGIALTRYLSTHGAHVVVSDRAPEAALADQVAAVRDCNVTLNLGGHDPALLLECALLFVSAGVPRSVPVLVEAVARGVPLSSETELFFDRCPVPITAITGSAGKTTTTTLTGKLLADAGRHVLVGGNIGRPLIGQLGDIRSDTKIVLELSSFQLQHLPVSPHVAAVLNVTPNHLDRHKDMAEYTEAKRQIVAHQISRDVAVLNADDPTYPLFATATPGRVVTFSLGSVPPTRDGVWVEDDNLMVCWQGSRDTVLDLRQLHIPGRHNVANVGAAVLLGLIHGVPMSSIGNTLRSFHGVEHRLELVSTVAGVRYINDSIATAPERLVAGIRAIEAPIVLIAGGRDKHLPWQAAAHLIADRTRAVVTLGEAAPLIEEAISQATGPSRGRPVIQRATSMEHAVSLATQLAHPGDVVLLSPGCTSFDRYQNFEARGHDFKEAVNRLAHMGASA